MHRFVSNLINGFIYIIHAIRRNLNYDILSVTRKPYLGSVNRCRLDSKNRKRAIPWTISFFNLCKHIPQQGDDRPRIAIFDRVTTKNISTHRVTIYSKRKDNEKTVSAISF